ncbi:amidohydrolase [Halogeometricum borinquense DSM 11551]|uniref:Amidohydrolase n=1 Tax=Halogeometricum borinquense (strain ATCC 700274 / DSM 11551 / JCM 10706 / KCTC 4070 / PR3) TaxID=469382 RepID=E4NT38_HALBP|nr:amidohydrolase family protein [Halogeometricum borinquense]ADQ67031.1 amidohydrolase, imidazolonepropionase [Halogeometricum borinquense DSM 11551]ELY29822.1 amidohydrolase [Halogeometricum borinquense DSM 11551]
MDADRLVFEGGRVADARGTRRADVVVDVETGRIIAVSDEDSVQPGDENTEAVDVSGKVVAPGLVDAHVHLMMDGRPDVTTINQDGRELLSYRAAANLRANIEAGVTTVRDLGAPGRLAIDAGVAVEEGVLDGPRVVACGENVVMTGGHGHWFGREADGAAEVQKAVREQLKRGAGVVKCMATGGVLTEGAVTGAPELTERELSAVVDTASAKGVPTAAHAHGEVGIKNAVRAGITSVEHGTFMDREAAELMAREGTYWVPTASALEGIVENGVEAGIPEQAVEKAEDAQDRFERAWEHALEAGVTIAMGTDAGTPFNFHGENALREMELMVEYGLSAEAALEAATINAAELLGVSDVGRIAEGYRADMLVLTDDPNENVSAWRGSEAVYRDGERVA